MATASWPKQRIGNAKKCKEQPNLTPAAKEALMRRLKSTGELRRD